MYADGKGVEKDEKEACRYYKLAADQGNVNAQFTLGYMYADGKGVEKDEKEACRYYKLAADQGNVNAQCNLGVMYSNGKGVEKNIIEALRLLIRSKHVKVKSSIHHYLLPVSQKNRNNETGSFKDML